MATETHHAAGAGTAHRPRRRSGWLAFAGTLALVVGAFNVIDGLVAMFRDDYYLVGDNRILAFDFTVWGWIWLILGALQILVGLAIYAGRLWARAIGVVFAVAAAIGHLAFLQAFPVWSVLTIALCVLLIYALTAPSSESTA
jgi:hypothetical protein